MPLPTKIVVIGAGSASFGENTLSALMRSRILKNSSIALVDHNLETLETLSHLAHRMNKEWKADIQLSAHQNYKDALDASTEFVISAIEVGAREGLWRKDFEIPLQFGVRQPYAENGGPGGFAHAARNISPILEIVKAMEQICPDAWFINFTNPMIRLCDLVNRFSRIKVVGLCHQIYIGYTMVGMALAQDLAIAVPGGIEGMHAHPLLAPLHEQVKKQIVPLVDIRAAGLNHFSWIKSIHHKKTGDDLYPLFRQRFFELDPSFEPLTRRIFEIFDLFPIPGDTHLCEYLPWMSDPVVKPWEKFKIRLYDWDMNTALRDFIHHRLNRMADGSMTIDGLLESDSEGALEVIENLAGASTHYHLAANLPNQGQIEDLPPGTIVETPVVFDNAGIHPVLMGKFPLPITELLHREAVVAQLCVDSVVEGDRNKALQCLLLDPVIHDIDTAQKILDSYLVEYKDYLPTFWE